MTKFTDLPVAGAQTGTEILAQVQGGVSKQVTVSQLLTGISVNAQVGNLYALQSSDNGKVITLTNALPITLTCPAGLGAAFSCVIIQLGAGQVTVAAGVGATLGAYLGLVNLAGQYAAATIIAPTANNFVVSGQMA